MGKTAAELRHDIEQQRANIGRDVDAIGDRVSPARIVGRRTDAVKNRMRTAKEAVMGSNEPYSPYSPYSQNSSPSVADRVSDTKDHAAALAHSAADGVADVPARVRSGTQGNPLGAGLVAFGVGLVAATLIPTSKREEDMARQLQPQLERAGGRLGETGRELVEELRPDVEAAVHEVTGEAAAAGQRLTGEVKEAAKDTADTAKASPQP